MAGEASEDCVHPNVRHCTGWCQASASTNWAARTNVFPVLTKSSMINTVVSWTSPSKDPLMEMFDVGEQTKRKLC
jgi:hypothetical protein